MHIRKPKKIVILGMMTKIPVAGHVWLIAHYMVGLRRLGFDPYYVEAHARTPSMLMTSDSDDSSALAAGFIDRFLRRFDLGDRWAFHALHDDGRCYGLSETELKQLYASAELIINLHGGTVALPEHYATGRLIYLETDPVEMEIELYNGDANTFEFCRPHCAFFTWGLNYNSPDCRVPLPAEFPFRHTRPPVLCDLWDNGRGKGDSPDQPIGRCPPERPEGSFAQMGTVPFSTFTTVGNWQQPWRDVVFQGEVYHWSKHFEYLKFVDLPCRRPQQAFELALSSCSDDDKKMLEERGWRVKHAMDISTDLDAYRGYVQQSRGEFTVAKDQNIRLRSGWFSERSAQYLAAGRPVITQETGFSNALPTGRGLFAFSTMDEILAAVDAVNSDYETHCRAAAEIAREYFNYDVVLGRLMVDMGISAN